MNLRLLLLLARLVHPKMWRTRLKQLGGLLGFIVWVWVRAVHGRHAARARLGHSHQRRASEAMARRAAHEAVIADAVRERGMPPWRDAE